MSWGITPRTLLTSIGFLTMLLPSIKASPEVGPSKQESRPATVDFPAPLGPRSPNILPASTSKETLSTAILPSKTFLRFLTSTMFKDASLINSNEQARKGFGIHKFYATSKKIFEQCLALLLLF